MKKILLLCSVLAGAMAAQAAMPSVNQTLKERNEARKESKARKAEAAAPGKEWKAQSWTLYTMGETDWVVEGEYKYGYNDKGQLSMYNYMGYMEFEYEYGEDGRLSSTITSYADDDYEPYSKTVYTYDPIIKDLVVEGLEYLYKKGQWRENRLTTDLKITRDADGNITKIVNSKQYGASITTDITYKDGKAVELVNTNFDGRESKVALHLTNIVWDRTNGQIVPTDDDELEPEVFFQGANRIKSATLVDYDDFDGNILLTASYPDENNSYAYVMNYEGKDILEYSYTLLDEYGSFKEIEKQIDFDEDEDSGELVPSEVEEQIVTVTLDKFGNSIGEVEEYYVDGEFVYKDDYIVDAKYDETYGYPLEYLVSYTRNGSEPVQFQKSVYGDYVEVASIISVATDENAPVEYFNLQGVRVSADNLPAGIYVRRQGSKATKVMIR